MIVEQSKTALGKRATLAAWLYVRLLCVSGLAVAIASGLAAQAVAAAEKKPLDWQRSTTVEARGALDDGNTVCQQISSNISKRVANIKTLQTAISKAASAPPTTVKSALEDIFGQRQPNVKVLEAERKIKVERNAAEELNVMMRASRCTPIDVDAALANHKVQERAAPEAPKAMPDDLVRTPQRY